MDSADTPQTSTARSRASTIDSASLGGTTPKPHRSRASSAYAIAYGCWTPSPQAHSCKGCREEEDDEVFIENRTVATLNEIRLAGLTREHDERDSDEYTVHLEDGCRVTKLTYESSHHSIGKADSSDDFDDISSTKAQPSEYTGPNFKQQRACDCDAPQVFTSCLDPPVVRRERVSHL